ncbi:hypothetical protein CANCADRAFT_116004 [Tortispora caseinolytica NRRL Y-17796]|uniref:Uncharacterized protein n=1 Tax=Tortispora caseinolytica NRRL Y-17796 TaxID=767744 RepID=A0A1E4TH62_9ASCO|nr:hypothetical protein CANCADRAFT_116004 [Tortispora caseinolytica NRRL Y-17796]
MSIDKLIGCVFLFFSLHVLADIDVSRICSSSTIPGLSGKYTGIRVEKVKIISLFHSSTQMNIVDCKGGIADKVISFGVESHDRFNFNELFCVPGYSCYKFARSHRYFLRDLDYYIDDSVIGTVFTCPDGTDCAKSSSLDALIAESYENGWGSFHDGSFQIHRPMYRSMDKSEYPKRKKKLNALIERTKSVKYDENYSDEEVRSIADITVDYFLTVFYKFRHLNSLSPKQKQQQLIPLPITPSEKPKPASVISAKPTTVSPPRLRMSNQDYKPKENTKNLASTPNQDVPNLSGNVQPLRNILQVKKSADRELENIITPPSFNSSKVLSAAGVLNDSGESNNHAVILSKRKDEIKSEITRLLNEVIATDLFDELEWSDIKGMISDVDIKISKNKIQMDILSTATQTLILRPGETYIPKQHYHFDHNEDNNIADIQPLRPAANALQNVHSVKTIQPLPTSLTKVVGYNIQSMHSIQQAAKLVMPEPKTVTLTVPAVAQMQSQAALDQDADVSQRRPNRTMKPPTLPTPPIPVLKPVRQHTRPSQQTNPFVDDTNTQQGISPSLDKPERFNHYTEDTIEQPLDANSRDKYLAYLANQFPTG